MPELKPFTPHSDALALNGEFLVTDAGLELRFQISDSKKILEKSLREKSWGASELRRVDGLWQSTCFEAFWGVPGNSSYWELNISAEGEWNLYHFNQYRSPQLPQPSQDFALESLRTTQGSLEAKLRGPAAAYEASLCAVLKTQKATHYYSTKHAGAKADFHLRESFCLRREQ